MAVGDKGLNVFGTCECGDQQSAAGPAALREGRTECYGQLPRQTLPFPASGAQRCTSRACAQVPGASGSSAAAHATGGRRREVTELARPPGRGFGTQGHRGRPWRLGPSALPLAGRRLAAATAGWRVAEGVRAFCTFMSDIFTHDNQPNTT